MKNNLSDTSIEQPAETTAAGGESEHEERVGTSLLDFIAVVTKWRKFIVRFILICSVLAVVIALLSPKWYKATASVLPADKTDMLSGLEGVSSLVRNFSPARGLSALTGGNETDRYVAILKSENVMLKVADRFNLTKVYDITSYPREKTLKELVSNTEIEVGTEGQLLINIYDTDPQRSADMANYFVQMLNDINAELHVINARANREFVEKRYSKNLVDLRNAEDSLKAYQIGYGVVAMPQQLEASIKAMAEIQGALAVKEVELDVLRRTLSPTHPNVLAAQIDVDALEKKIRDLNNGEGAVRGQMNVLVPFNRAPDLGVKYLRLFREVEIQTKILQYVTPMYEQAKVEEQRETPSVIALDRALMPERKAKPKILLYGLIALVASTIMSFVLVFGIEGWRKFRMIDPGALDDMWAATKGDWFGIKWAHKKRR